MTTYVYTVPDHLTTRQVNDLIRAAVCRALTATAAIRVGIEAGTMHNYSRRRAYGRHEYVHGMGHGLRDTWVATWDVTDRTLRLSGVPNYPGWDKADAYTRTRIVALDTLRSMPGIMPLHNYGGGR